MKIKKIAYLGLILSLAIILGYVEMLIPMPFFIPGMKLGLGNLAVLFTLYHFGTKEATVISIMKVLMTTFFFGNFFSLTFSLGGGLVALGIMVLCKKMGVFSYIGVSMAGGVAHNIGQLMVAAFVLNPEALIHYMPVLLISGLVTGFVLGIVKIPDGIIKT